MTPYEMIILLTSMIISFFLGYISFDYVFGSKKKKHHDPTFKDVEFDRGIYKRISDLIDTEEKRKKLHIYEEVGMFTYFLLPPAAEWITQNIDIDRACPLICLVGQDTKRLYIFPLYLLFPEYRQLTK